MRPKGDYQKKRGNFRSPGDKLPITVAAKARGWEAGRRLCVNTCGLQSSGGQCKGGKPGECPHLCTRSSVKGVRGKYTAPNVLERRGALKHRQALRAGPSNNRSKSQNKTNNQQSNGGVGGSVHCPSCFSGCILVLLPSAACPPCFSLEDLHLPCQLGTAGERTEERNEVKDNEGTRAGASSRAQPPLWGHRTRGAGWGAFACVEVGRMDEAVGS